MSKRRVVITGLGAVSPFGERGRTDLEKHTGWAKRCRPYHIFRRQRVFHTLCCPVKDLDTGDLISKQDERRFDGFIIYGMYAAAQAMKDAGLVVTEENGGRMGVAIGSGIGGASVLEGIWDAIEHHGPRKVNPFSIPGSIINMVAGKVSMMFGLRSQYQRCHSLYNRNT